MLQEQGVVAQVEQEVLSLYDNPLPTSWVVKYLNKSLPEMEQRPEMHFK